MAFPQPIDDQLRARRQLDEARQAFRARKVDTRRKIVAGAVVLAEMDCNPAFRALLQLVLQRRLTRPADRQLFADLLG